MWRKRIPLQLKKPRSVKQLPINDPGRLSHQESIESTDCYLSYYENDLVVIDWDAALIVDERKHFDKTLYILELANLEAYDRLLNDALERAYRDLRSQPVPGRDSALRELREIRIDLVILVLGAKGR